MTTVTWTVEDGYPAADVDSGPAEVADLAGAAIRRGYAVETLLTQTRPDRAVWLLQVTATSGPTWEGCWVLTGRDGGTWVFDDAAWIGRAVKAAATVAELRYEMGLDDA